MLCAAKKVYALDSFAGFRADAVQPRDIGAGRTLAAERTRFRQDEASVALFRSLALRLKLNLEVVPGWFEDTLPAVANANRFCFVPLDCDIYQSYRTCLPLLYPRLVPGGIMLFDEYRSREWPGAMSAVDEFLADKREKPVMVRDAARPQIPKYMIVKE
ncbi:MAG: TylF/MycF/NovP-related O-methyltransferase [Gammaproteobacteria bacterium]